MLPKVCGTLLNVSTIMILNFEWNSVNLVVIEKKQQQHHLIMYLVSSL